MADPKPAIVATLVNEGYYSNNAADTGKRTYRGISQVNFPTCAIWTPIMAWIHLHGEPGSEHRFTDIPGLEELVYQFYIDHFWTPIQGNQIINQQVANDLFDSSVNMGVHQAVVLTQRSLGIPESGHMDYSTLNTLNLANSYA